MGKYKLPAVLLQPIRKLPCRVLFPKTCRDVKIRCPEERPPAANLKKPNMREVEASQNKKKPFQSRHAVKAQKMSQLVPMDDVPGEGSSEPPRVVTERGEKVEGRQRLKVVVTRKRLLEMLSSANITLEDMLFQAQEGKSSDSISRTGWRPRLATIPEGCEQNFRAE